jgi:hypothetical protein
MAVRWVARKDVIMVEMMVVMLEIQQEVLRVE